jgi:DNA-directed RNA polymerase subunit alpha
MKKFYLSCVESRIDDPKNLYARFKIGPFEKNHTLTIANNLRRTLLSELDSIAIIAIKIQGVKHEYSSLPGVRESVLDILLNIKQIALASVFEIHSPHVAYLSATEPGIVTANDIKFPPFLKCVDPDQKIATLSNDGKLEILFLIYPGKNYWIQLGSNQFITHCTKVFNKASLTDQTKKYIQSWQGGQANILPVDAVFMPINRVNYTIESDEEIDTEQPFEHIFLEIWTNGSIHPVTAIEKAATSLVELFKPFQNIQSLQLEPKFLTLKPIKNETYENVSINSKRKLIGLEVEDGINPSSILDLDIGNLNLSLRPYTCLKRANIQNVRDLLKYSREELLLFKNFGKRSLEEVESSLYKIGFFLYSQTDISKQNNN